MKCDVCGECLELRPYGHKGALICFDCMMASQESRAEGERQFAAHLDAIDETDIVLTPNGPVGASHFRNEP